MKSLGGRKPNGSPPPSPPRRSSSPRPAAGLHCRAARGQGVRAGGPDRRDADSHARQLVSNAKKNADQIVGGAKTQAGQLLAETRADAERRRAAVQRDVDELTRQKDSIAAHLAQVRQVVGGQLPGMDPAPPKPTPETRVRTRRSRRPASTRSLIVTRPSCQPRSGNWTQ